MAADGDTVTCLSDFSDDLLRHILSFVPARARAATAVLSRRWLRLWRTSGEVYIDSRSFTGGCSTPDQESKAFLHGAGKALAVAAAHGPIKSLTVTIAEGSKMSLVTRGNRSLSLMDALVSNPAARRVEELNVVVTPLNRRCTVSLGSLPSVALRQLRLINCSALTTSPSSSSPGAAAAAFPMLVELHLEDCNVSPVDLQTIVDAAPQLSTLHLISSRVSIEDTIDAYDEEQEEQVVVRLLLPAVTNLLVADCSCRCGFLDEFRLELDVPRLQYFRYKGHVQQTNSVSLKPRASSNMIQVDLRLTYDNHFKTNTPIRKLFWKFIQSFKTTKILKLELVNLTMDNLALEDTASRDELLDSLSFDLLEQLELEAKYNYNNPGSKGSMVMLANLLHCCPTVRDLRLRFGKRYYRMPWIESSIYKEAGLHFDKSVDGFRNRRRKSMASLGAQIMNDVDYEAFGIPGFTGEHSFSCLQSHLQRVSLQFFMDEPNCIEVQLAKFFAENAMVLQEMHIDDGNQEMLEHLNSTVRRWIANTRT